MGSPSSATPRASSTWLKSDAVTGWAAAGDTGPRIVATAPVADRTAAAAAAIRRVLIGRSHSTGSERGRAAWNARGVEAAAGVATGGSRRAVGSFLVGER